MPLFGSLPTRARLVSVLVLLLFVEYAQRVLPVLHAGSMYSGKVAFASNAASGFRTRSPSAVSAVPTGAVRAVSAGAAGDDGSAVEPASAAFSDVPAALADV